METTNVSDRQDWFVLTQRGGLFFSEWLGHPVVQYLKLLATTYATPVLLKHTGTLDSQNLRAMSAQSKRDETAFYAWQVINDYQGFVKVRGCAREENRPSTAKQQPDRRLRKGDSPGTGRNNNSQGCSLSLGQTGLHLPSNGRVNKTILFMSLL